MNKQERKAIEERKKSKRISTDFSREELNELKWLLKVEHEQMIQFFDGLPNPEDDISLFILNFKYIKEDIIYKNKINGVTETHSYFIIELNSEYLEEFNNRYSKEYTWFFNYVMRYQSIEGYRRKFTFFKDRTSSLNVIVGTIGTLPVNRIKKEREHKLNIILS